MSASPRLVLDTNVLVSALVYDDPRHEVLRRGWQARALVPLMSAATHDELRRVLAYPQFALSAERIAVALGTLEPFVEWVSIDAAAVAALRRCSDRDDQKFLETAFCGGAHAILSYDRVLLKMRRHAPCPVRTPEAWLAEHPVGA
ncbi:MAG: putative toxin-antitoxin system toxin component, PIN family [Proteobacteria bacterium]|nr:putative toxin-antitoxin system toxin component, PIN family [Pseudomonadota bacterium]